SAYWASYQQAYGSSYAYPSTDSSGYYASASMQQSYPAQTQPQQPEITDPVALAAKQFAINKKIMEEAERQGKDPTEALYTYYGMKYDPGAAVAAANGWYGYTGSEAGSAASYAHSLAVNIVLEKQKSEADSVPGVTGANESEQSTSTASHVVAIASTTSPEHPSSAPVKPVKKTDHVKANKTSGQSVAGSQRMEISEKAQLSSQSHVATSDRRTGEAGGDIAPAGGNRGGKETSGGTTRAREADLRVDVKATAPVVSAVELMPISPEEKVQDDNGSQRRSQPPESNPYSAVPIFWEDAQTADDEEAPLPPTKL
ncbi:hypothetical protein HDU93_002343, partial [Gonapodya sp. JEL0774]